jgi:hypothetical protein
MISLGRRLGRIMTNLWQVRLVKPTFGRPRQEIIVGPLKFYSWTWEELNLGEGGEREEIPWQ